MIIKAIPLFRFRAVGDFLSHFVLWLTLMVQAPVCHFKIIYWHTSDFLPTVLAHLRHKLCLSEYSRSRPFGHILCVFDRLDAPEAQSVICLSVLERAAQARAHTHTRTRAHTLQPGEQRLSRGLYFQRFISKHVPQFSNSKDGILQQSPMMILTLVLVREERMCTTVKGWKLC